MASRCMLGHAVRCAGRGRRPARGHVEAGREGGADRRRPASTGAGEVAPAVGFLTGTPVQGRIGVGWATLRDVRPDPAAAPSLTVGDVDRAFERVGGHVRRRRHGRPPGAAGRRLRPGDRAPSRGCCGACFSGELRHGALDGVMVEAIAKAAVGAGGRRAPSAHDVGRPRRSSRGRAVRWRAGAGRSIAMSPGRAVQPMLASPAADVAARVAGDRAGLGRVEARRRPDPGPSARRRRAAVHPQPQRDHRAPRRRRRLGGRAARRRPRARRRGARCRRRGHAAPLPGHDGRLRRRCADAARRRAVGLLLRRAPRRRRSRPSTSRWSCAASCWPRSCRRRRGCRRWSPPTPTRRRRSSTALSPPATRA